MSTFKLPTAAAATPIFSGIIRAWLTADQIAVVIAGDADVDDFCDSNMAIMYAIEELAPGFEDALDMASQEQADLCTAIWADAKANNYAV